MFLLVVRVSLEECLFVSSAHSLIILFIFSEQYEFFIFDTNFLYMICKYFLPFSRLPFHLVDGFLHSAEAKSLIQSKFIFAFGVFAFGVKAKKSLLKLMPGGLVILNPQFDKDCIESVDCFGQCGHFNSILPVHEHGISFHLFVSSSMCFINVLYLFHFFKLCESFKVYKSRVNGIIIYFLCLPVGEY